MIYEVTLTAPAIDEVIEVATLTSPAINETVTLSADSEEEAINLAVESAVNRLLGEIIITASSKEEAQIVAVKAITEMLQAGTATVKVTLPGQG